MSVDPKGGFVVALARTSLPILLSRLAQTVAMVAGTIMLGRLGHQELAASALATSLSIALFTFGSGTLFSLGPVFSRTRVADDLLSIRQIFYHGLFLASIIGLVIMLILFNAKYFLLAAGQDPKLVALTQSYFDYLSFGVIPMLWITAIQQLFIGIGQPVIVLIYSLIRLPLSILSAYLFIFGKWGLPAFGMAGLGLSISILSAISCLILLAYLFFSVRFSTLFMFRARPLFQFDILTRIAHLGLPIGIQYSGEIAAYLVATLFMGWIGQSALVAQQITSQYILLAMMIPFALAQAVSVDVAGHLGANQYRTARLSGNIGVVMVLACMAIPSLLFVVFPSELAQPFLKSSEDIVDVVHIASLLFMIAAFSQILDAIRNVLGGALRAYDNTRNPMLAGIMAFWFIGLPLGYVLAFPLQFGVVGIPIGMATGIMIATVAVQRMYASELKQIVHRS